MANSANGKNGTKGTHAANGASGAAGGSTSVQSNLPVSATAGSLAQVDPEVYEAIEREAERLRSTIQLIPSENYPSAAVMEATGSVLTTKYAEGYPRKRFYQGNAWIDVVEELARKRARRLFGADHANVQPHSGSSANMAVYYAALQVGDTVLGMNLAAGGHLTHGSPVNFSSRLYKFVEYGVDPKTERIDYDQLARIAREQKPKMIVVGATAYPRVFEWERIRQICDDAGAFMLADMAHIAGLVAGGAHPSPVPYAEYVSFTTHKTLRGPRGGMVLCKKPYAEGLDKAVFPGLQGGPLEHVIAAKAVMLKEAAQPSFKGYAHAVVENARVLAETLRSEGLNLVSGGTDNHLVLVRLAPDGPTGRQTAEALERAGLICNFNTVPGETRAPWHASGIRLGSPAATTFGFGVDEFREIGRLIAPVVKDISDTTLQERTLARVRELCEAVETRRETVAESAAERIPVMA